MISVDYHADLKEVQSDPALAALLGDRAQSAPFDRLAWWQGLADHCGLEPLVAIARDGADRAVLPLAEGRGGVAAFANWYTFRFRPVVSAGADGRALIGALARDLATRGRARHRSPGCRAKTAAATCSTPLSGGRLGGLLASACDTNHIAAARRTVLGDLSRQPPRPACAPRSGASRASWTPPCSTASIPRAWARLRGDLRAAAGSRAKARPLFLRRFAEQEGAAGRLRLGIARADGRPVAAQLWTVEGGTAFIHKLAHAEDAEPFARHRAQRGAVRPRDRRRRVATVDFGTGDDPFKRTGWKSRARATGSTCSGPMARQLAADRRAKIARLAGRDKHG